MIDYDHFLDTQPYPYWCIDRKTKQIRWANKASEEWFSLKKTSIAGIPLTDLILQAPEETESIDSIYKHNIHTLRVLFNFSNPNVSTALKHAGSTRFERVVIASTLTDSDIILSFRQLQNPLFNIIASTFTDFYIMLNKDNSIDEIITGYTFFPMQRKNAHGSDLSEIMNKNDADEIIEREKLSLSYLQSLSKTSTGRWTNVVSDNFRTLDNWIIDREFRPLWFIKNESGLTCKPDGTTAYIYSNSKIETKGKDISITLSTTITAYHRIAVMICCEQPNPWIISGYSIGFNIVNGEPFVSIKKHSLFAKYAKLLSTPKGKTTLRVDKTGGHFTVSINDQQICEWYDLSPEPEDNRHFGILSNGDSLITGVSFNTRESKYDSSRTFKAPRITLGAFEGRVFEAHLFQLAAVRNGLVREQRTLLFKDVTEIAKVEEDRDSATRIGQLLKAKDYYGFVGGNSKIISIIDKIEKFADTDTAIFIEGPTGSGKEVLANAIHRRSRRRDGPFVKVDCSTIPSSLMESELFGHEKGAFTGAGSRRIGKFESADGGTLFLDEIGNIDSATQAKLLDFLESHSFSRIGDSERRKIDVRIITATNASLMSMVKAKTFREDLYYRINVVALKLPPLRDRIDDIPLLTAHIIQDINTRHKLDIHGVSKSVMNSLLMNEWHGNVRELYNTLLRLAVDRKNGMIDSAPENIKETSTSEGQRQFIPEHIRESRILSLLDTQPFFSAQDCRKVLPVSLPTIRRDLQKLQREGKLKTVGKGPAKRYVAGQPQAAPVSDKV
ncbi:MAG: sigma 54-interacting transcriptional regulator [Fibrobacteres bacterium]|nr:sigma 54-interacting transcriptional regulator [Fibrobacterota bacterium]